MRFRLGAPVWWGIPALLILLWAGGLLAIKQYPGLPTPPEFIMWALPSLRFSRDIASMVTVGALIVGGLLLATPSRQMRTWAMTWALAWLAALSALLLATVCEVTAMTPIQAARPSIWWPFLRDTAPGHVFGLQAIGVLLVLGLTWFRTGSALRWASVITAVVAASSPAFLGHGGFSTAHISLTISLGIHIAAASIWVGALIVTVAAVLTQPTSAPALLPRFSLLALWCVIVLGEAGLLNASLRVGSASLLVGTLYGSLVLVKIATLGWLVRIGWLQRSRVLPSITGNPGRLELLSRIAAWEFTLMGLAIAVAVVLSRIGFEGVASVDGSFAPLAIPMIGIALPLLINSAFPLRRAPAWVRGLSNSPEIVSVVLLIVIVEVTGLGAFSAVLGIEFGAMTGSLVLGFVGWLWCVSVDGPRRTSGILVLLLGFPVSIGVVALMASSGSGWQLWLLSAASGEGLILWMLSRTHARQTAVLGRAIHV